MLFIKNYNKQRSNGLWVGGIDIADFFGVYPLLKITLLSCYLGVTHLKIKVKFLVQLFDLLTLF